MADDEPTAALSSIQQRYPALRGYDWAVVDSRGKPSKYGGGIEFYSPDEPESPQPGRPTIEVFDADLKGKALETAIMGDMLHHLPSVDQTFAGMREQLRSTLTPEQLAIDQKAYEKSKAEYGEDRPFEDWMHISRLDAYVRGRLAPDKNDEWKDAYTPEQKTLIDGMGEYLKKGPATEATERAPRPRRQRPATIIGGDDGGSTIIGNY
jgi:hypothetical protein